MSADLVFTKGTAPATPPSGTSSIYTKSDGLFYTKDDAGIETPLKGDPGVKGDQGPGVPLGGTTSQLLKKNSNADNDTSWVDPPNSAVWGLITGTLASQSDLGTALGAKEATANKDTDSTMTANSDVKYPSQKAVKTALATKQASLGFTAEDSANKDTDIALTANSDTKYASQKAIKSYVDTGLATKQASLGFTAENVANKDTDGTLSANSDTKYASQKATKTYVDAGLSGKQASLGYTAASTSTKVNGIPLSDGDVRAGGMNYISLGNFEVSAGFTAYADAAAATPADGTGGSPTVTATRTTSSPLRGTGSLLITKDAANRQGEGAGYAFGIDAADQAKVLTIAFDYAINSGTYADGDLTVWIYDVTNATLTQPAPYRILNIATGLAARWSGAFQSASNSTSYRVILHCASTSASAYTVKIDNFSVGPQQVSTGPAVTDWVAYTPTLAGITIGNGTVTGKSRQVGDSEEIEISVASGSSTTFSGTYTFSTPHTVDTAKITNANQTVGNAWLQPPSAANYNGAVLVNNSTTLVVVGPNVATTWGSTSPVASTNGAGTTISIRATVPVLGWSSSQSLSSNDSEGRLVSFVGTQSSQAVTANVTNIAFTSGKDTHGAWNGTQYVVPVPGDYNVASSMTASALATGVFYLNGSASALIMSTIPSGGSNGAGGGILYNLKAGDLISLRSTTSVTITLGQLSISRIAGNQQIAASESISASYGGSDATALTATLVILKGFTLKNHDTHGVVNATTGVITIPSAGLYSFYGQMQSSASASAGGQYNLITLHTGSVAAAGTALASNYAYQTASGGDSMPTIRKTIRCNAGDTFTFQVASTEGASRTIYTSTDTTFIGVDRIGN